MASWERLRFETQGATVERPTDKNITMADRTAGPEWSVLVSANESRKGFLVQNTSQVEMRIRSKGDNATGARLPGYGDSFAPDFEPHGAYEVQADDANSTFVLTVW